MALSVGVVHKLQVQAGECSISGDEQQVVGGSLGEQEPVERVVVVKPGEAGDVVCCSGCQGKFFET